MIQLLIKFRDLLIAILGLGAGAVLLSIGAPIESQLTYFAEISPNETVLRVIVISPEVLATGKWGDPANWVQTYMEKDPQKNPKKSYAGIGYTYDKTRDYFISPKPHPEAILDESTARWIIPNTLPAVISTAATST